MGNKMASGYYEHNIEVKFTENLLTITHDWKWFIEYTEANFNPPAELFHFDDFSKCFSPLKAVYLHLCKIVDTIGSIDAPISAPWLSRLYDCALVRSGNVELNDAIKGSGFYDVLAVASYATQLMNCVSHAQYLYNPQLLFTSNLHELYDFGALGEKRWYFIAVVESLDIQGSEEVAANLNLNFRAIAKPVDEDRVSRLLDECFDADFLSYKDPEKETFQTWEEELLCDALSVSYSNGEIEPVLRFKDGTGRPNVSSWTKALIKNAKASFVDVRAACIFETIEFALFGSKPSQKAQEMLVDLCLKRASECAASSEHRIWNLSCTAFNVVQDLIRLKQLDDPAKSSYFKGMKETLKDFLDYRSICFMKEHRLPCTDAQNHEYELHSEKATRDLLDAIKDAHGLIQVFKNSQVARTCSKDDAERALALLVENSVAIEPITADLFYWAMQFYIDALDNSALDNRWVKRVLIGLWENWRDRYYDAVLKTMNVRSYEQSVSSEEIENLNREFLASPQALARYLILQSDEAISSSLETMSEHVVTIMFNKTTVSEYYPEHFHVDYSGSGRSIDGMITEEILRVYKDRSYRCMNAMKEQEMIDGFYEEMSQRISIVAQMINVQPAYEWLARNLGKPYKLSPFPGVRPSLGDLMQLFPILENSIRNIGELFAVVPFQADKRNYVRLKEVSAVLSDLVKEVKDITGTIQGCNEFLFVYHVMYSQNGLNIRNDCVHGRRYQDPSGIAYAFRLTVICAYMMLKRLRSLELLGAESESLELSISDDLTTQVEE